MCASAPHQSYYAQPLPWCGHQPRCLFRIDCSFGAMTATELKRGCLESSNNAHDRNLIWPSPAVFTRRGEVLGGSQWGSELDDWLQPNSTIQFESFEMS